jgi:hypothetical protein
MTTGAVETVATYTIQSDQSPYAYGTNMTLSVTSSNGQPISNLRDNIIHIYEGSVTKYSPDVWISHRELMAVTSGSDVTILIQFGFGQYKAVFYEQSGNKYSAVSNIFEVTKPIGITIQTDQSTYRYGTAIIASINVPSGIQLTGGE